ncbi:MAG: type II toxin-antitoxin system RelE/ParE family toxin [Chloroflexia bacterium]
MVANNDWSVVFFTEEGGRSPVREFLESLDLKTQARLRRALELLTQPNDGATEQLVRCLEGELWELRVASVTNNYRLIYFSYADCRIVILHGFRKTTQTTPRHEIETASRRLEDFQMRKGM